MLRTLLKTLLFFSAIPFSYSQNDIETISIQWDEKIKKSQISVDNYFSYLSFEGATFNSENLQLPVYTKQVRLNSYGKLSVRLNNEQYSPIENIAEIDFSTIEDIEIKTAVSFARKKAIGVISFVPIRKNPSTGAYEKLIKADLEITLQPEQPITTQTRNFTSNSKLSSGEIYKIAISKTGIYKMDYAFLKSLGLDMNTIDPRKIQLLGNGGRILPERMNVPTADDLEENAIFIKGEDDGAFNQGDYILFYGLGVKNWSYEDALSCGNFEHSINPYTKETYYFIKVSNTNGKRIQSKTSLNSYNYTTSSYDALKFHELNERNLMEAQFDLPPSGREWYGEAFRITRTRNFSFNFKNRIETEPIIIHSDLAVRAADTGTVALQVNNTLINQRQTPATNIGSSYVPFALKTSFACSPLIIDGQTINTQIEFIHNSSAAEMWLNYIRVHARCELNFTSGQLPFRDIKTIGQGSARYELNNANGISIWDVTNPSNVQIQEYTTANPSYFNTEADSYKEFIAFDNNQFYNPSPRGSISNQNLHGTTIPPDAVFIYHSSLRTQAERLAEHRRVHSNMTIDLVNVQDIYNEFGSGNPDITAIRNYCKMLYDRETSSNKFTHLLLFGIGTFDYKSIGYTRTEENNPNLIPLYQSPESLHPITTYTSDDYFALLDPSEHISQTGFLDIAVGRIPVSNLSEAKIIVDKIIAYDKDPSHMKDWRNRIAFVADDDDGNEYFYGAERIISISEYRDSTYNIEKIYFDAFKQESTTGGERYPAAKNSLLDVLFKGSLIVNYIGHGANDGWGQERVFTNSDIVALKNKDKLPLFITATCSFAPHDDPSIVSAGELLLLNPNGGAVSLFTTVRVVVSDQNEFLIRNTFNVIFNKNLAGKNLTTGEVMQSSKNNGTGASPINTRKYALLGDPTMTLAYPQYTIRTNSINNNSSLSGQDTIKALQLVTIIGDVIDDNNSVMTNFNGTIYPTVFDKEDRLYTLGNEAGSPPQDFLLRKKIIFKGQATVENGRFSFSFVVPKDINYTFGYGKLSYYAEDGSMIDAHGHYPGLIVGGSQPNAVIDNQGPEVLVYMNNEEFSRGGITDKNPKILVQLYDENGINTVGNSIGHDLTAKLTTPNQNEEEYILNDFYESTKDDYTRGTAIYPLKDLDPGLHTVKVKAWDVYNNPAEGSTEFVVAESANMALNHVLNYPNPFTTSTNFQFEHNYPYQPLEVQIQIYTVSGKLIKTINHDISAEINTGYRVSDIHWDGLDDYGDRIGKGVYIYKIFAQAAGAAESNKQSSEFQKLVILK